VVALDVDDRAVAIDADDRVAALDADDRCVDVNDDRFVFLLFGWRLSFSESFF
jgi:hypothetical protein